MVPWVLALTAGLVGCGVPDRSGLSVEYVVEVVDPSRASFHVAASFEGVEAPTFDVALPVWTPGVYDQVGYARNVTRMSVRGEDGGQLDRSKITPSRWRIDTPGARNVRVEFDYAARDMSWNGAGVAPTHALFTGTQLFLEPVGHRDAPSTVRFVVPPGWAVASALRPTEDPLVFEAAGYDELVDAPTVLGSLEVTRFEAGGIPHEVVIAPAGAECSDDLDGYVASFETIVAVQAGIFGALPYDRYVVFCVADMAGGSLEHAASYVTSWLHPSNAAHELFHVWNVKRIRPAELWPYDYARVAPGPSLWMAEGVTSYYEALTAYRAGLPTGADVPSEGAGAVLMPAADPGTWFLKHLAYRISQLESNPERHHVSPSDASISDGLGFGAVAPSYYTSGELIGALLDLSILGDTDGRRSLDDVMRTLYRDFYERGRGFTASDLIAVVSETAGRDYRDFFDRHVTGTEPLPYDTVFGLAGLRVSSSTRTLGGLGLNASSTAAGRRVGRSPAPGSPAGRAGIVAGDEITAVDGVPIHDVPLTNVFGANWIGGRLLDGAGERVVLTVVRSGATLQLPVTLATVEEVVFSIDPVATPTTHQLMVREAWLRR